MTTYKNGKIYCLRSHQTDDVYIGSTIQSLAQRKAGHVSMYRKWVIDSKHPLSSFDIVKYDDCYIELVEDFSCARKEQLLMREGEIMRITPNCINRYIAGGLTLEENKEKREENSKKYYEQNKETIGERKKQHYEQNKDILLKQAKEYRTLNKTAIAERHSKTKNCVCGAKIVQYQMERHQLSQTHQNLMSVLDNTNSNIY
jgi:hypothetical protein